MSRRLLLGLVLALSMAPYTWAQQPAAEPTPPTDTSKPREIVVENKVTGGLEGVNNDTLDGGDGTGSALVKLKVIQLQLHKRSHSVTSEGKMDAKPLPMEAKVVLGQLIYFTLYIDNLTDAELFDANMVDQLDEAAFVYVANSLELAVTEAKTPAKEDDFKVRITEDRDEDPGFMSDTPGSPAGRNFLFIGQAQNQQNSRISIPAGKRLTIRFKVQVQ